MRRRHADLQKHGGLSSVATLLGLMSAACLLAYAIFSPFFAEWRARSLKAIEEKNSRGACCRGLEHLELWGRVVVWGDKHFVNSSQECCRACKALCTDHGGCQCNSWVFCGVEEACGAKFGQCWLKKQEDALVPDVQESGGHVMWTSGVVYGKDVGVMGIETAHGTIHMKLLVDCAPLSVAYILELVKLRHCAGCQLYRAESRGSSWDDEGKLIAETATTGPYGLLQGSLAVQAVPFKELPREACPAVRRGSVGWIGGGPEFFISLANHDEWYPKHTLFAHVLPEDMHIVEKLANLPTESSTWSGVNVALLQESIPIKIVKTTSPKNAEVISG